MVRRAHQGLIFTPGPHPSLCLEEPTHTGPLCLTPVTLPCLPWPLTPGPHPYLSSQPGPPLKPKGQGHSVSLSPSLTGAPYAAQAGLKPTMCLPPQTRDAPGLARD